MPKWIKVEVPDDFEETRLRHLHSDDRTHSYRVWQPQYKEVLNYGFVGLVDFMGDDDAIVQAARVSYGKGTKSVSEDEGLIRFLKRHFHTTPFEMVEFKFHIKAPIFVFRQWHRHRTFSINEYSARYSEMIDEFYIPEHEHTTPQSGSNKQGRDLARITDEDYKAIQIAVDHIYDESYLTYRYLLGEEDTPDFVNARKVFLMDCAVRSVEEVKTKLATGDFDDIKDHYKEYTKKDGLEKMIEDTFKANGFSALDDEFPGIARELARMVLPVATYSQMYWKGNLHNLMHFMRLRSDSHAQYEIRVYSDAIMEMITPFVPAAMRAFEDYSLHAVNFSRTEMIVVKEIINEIHGWRESSEEVKEDYIQGRMKELGASNREIKEFLTKLE